MRVLVVGGGLTAGALRHFLSQSSSASLAHLDLRCWESEAQLGGRMRTERLDERAFCDTGAQYLTRFTEDFRGVFDHLEREGLIKEIDSAHEVIAGMRDDQRALRHYAPVNGFSQVVSALAGDLQVERNTRVVRIEFERDTVRESAQHTHTTTSSLQSGLRVTAQTTKNENTVTEKKAETISDVFDVVVLTTPAPIAREILSPELLSAVPQNWAQGSLRDFFDSTSYSSRFAFAAFYSLSAATASEVNTLSWRSKYDFEDDMLRFISIENYKHTASWSALRENDTLALLLHSSIPFALQHKDTPRNEIEQRFVEKIRKYFPSLSGAVPLRTSLRHWAISQASKPSIDVAERHLLLSCDDDNCAGTKLIVAGDMFLGSNFENTLRSAKASAETILKVLSDRQECQ